MRKRVVVVENDEDIRGIIVTILKGEGYFVEGIRQDDHSIARIKEIQPDLILLDIISITAGGTQLCEAIRATEPIKQIPLIVLSTHTQIYKVKELCADEVLEKPFDIDELLEVVASAL